MKHRVLCCHGVTGKRTAIAGAYLLSLGVADGGLRLGQGPRIGGGAGSDRMVVESWCRGCCQVWLHIPLPAIECLELWAFFLHLVVVGYMELAC